MADINGIGWFDRKLLRKSFFGKSDLDGSWLLKTSWLDRDTLQVTMERMKISDATMRVMVNCYLGLDPNSLIIKCGEEDDS